MQPGVNASPMHPHGHCSTAPYIDREKQNKIDKNSVQNSYESGIIKEKDIFEYVKPKDFPNVLKESGNISDESRKYIYPFRDNGKVYGYVNTSNSFKINEKLRKGGLEELSINDILTVLHLDNTINNNRLKRNVLLTRYVSTDFLNEIFKQNEVLKGLNLFELEETFLMKIILF